MKRFLKLSIVLIAIVCIFTNVYAAINCTAEIQTTKTEYEKNEEVVVTVKLSNFQTERGIIAFGGTLEYDKNSLEFVKIDGQNGWNPSFNDANGKMLMERNDFITTDTNLIQITFKVKETSNKNVTITLKDMSIADGNEESKIQNVTREIQVKDGQTNPTPDNNNINNNVTDNTIINNEVNNNIINNVISNNTVNNSVNITTNTNNTQNTATGKLPQTGTNDVLLGLLILAIIVCIGLYVRKKIIDKK